MPSGIPKAGYRRTKHYEAKTIDAIEKDIAAKVPKYIEELEKLTKPIVCPNCGETIRVIDKDVAIYLINRAMGMPKQVQQIDITERIELSANQVMRLMERYQIVPQLTGGGLHVDQGPEEGLPKGLQGETERFTESSGFTELQS